MRVSLHSLWAFLFGFIGANIFMIPVELLLGIVPLAIVFTVAWTYAWVHIGARFNFYTKGIVAYSMGSGMGIVLNLLYYQQITSAVLHLAGL